MNDSVQLRLIFATSDGARRTLSLSNISAKPSAETAEALMTTIANTNMFVSKGVVLYARPLEAWYVATTVEQIYQA
ncbi:DUF2922 domain-containing protein [Lacticaseibacillus kribbianus]|uniref:DUF2922 domain-containing protein n=1 Tax=Lacticaseibacillus kribbianus TaxID=2926292 RepID=UPI001CD55EFC|nr:DUF2922 domain-containing protein [Lacticaseibacillus kribbianus]